MRWLPWWGFLVSTILRLECLLSILGNKKKRSSFWAHLHKHKAQTLPKVMETFFSWPHSGRVAVFTDLILHLPSHIRTSISWVYCSFWVVFGCVCALVGLYSEYVHAYMHMSVFMWCMSKYMPICVYLCSCDVSVCTCIYVYIFVHIMYEHVYAYMYMSVFMWWAILFTWSLGETLFQNAEIINLLCQFHGRPVI